MVALSPNLKKRILTITVGAPILVAVVLWGGWAFIATLLLATVISMYEWLNMARKSRFFIMLSVFGCFFILVGFLSINTLRVLGFEYIMMLLLGVWASDSVAYIFGKTVKGPKMSPTISPNKTWSGYVGALLGPVIVMVVFSFYSGHFPLSSAVILGAMVGVVGQSGDLLVSALKRHTNVKDTGHILPGHGGILDRVDALLLVAPVFLSMLTIISSSLWRF